MDRKSAVLLGLTALGIVLFGYGAHKVAKVIELRAHGIVALADAIRAESPDELRHLLDLGADPNTKARGESLLSFAVGLDQRPHMRAKIELLLDAGADPNWKNEDDITPRELNLYLAEFGFDSFGVPSQRDVRLELDARLVEAGAEDSLLSHILLQQWEAVRKKVEHNPDLVNEQLYMYRTPLHWAEMMGNLEFSHYLVEQGADPMARDMNGNTPLRLYVSNQMAQRKLSELVFANERLIEFWEFIPNEDDATSEAIVVRAQMIHVADLIGLDEQYFVLDDFVSRAGPLPRFEVGVFDKFTKPRTLQWIFESKSFPLEFHFPTELYTSNPQVLSMLLNEEVSIVREKGGPLPLLLATMHLKPASSQVEDSIRIHGAQMAVIRRLLAMGEDPLETAQNGQTPWELAEQTGRGEVIYLFRKNLVERGLTPPNETNESL